VTTTGRFDGITGNSQLKRAAGISDDAYVDQRPISIDRVLSQEEIDNVFKSRRDTASDEDPAKLAITYDFRRPDRIAKDQLRAIHMLHENFGRTLASSLSAYLRAYVIVNLVSVEQLSFMEFSQCLPSPTIITALGMKPYDGNAVLEMNPSLVFPVIEMLLGGSGKPTSTKFDREITEIEQSILDGIYRIILNDLKEAWSGVTHISFNVEARETEPQMLQILAPNEAVVAISMEVRIGENVGMLNMGIPSIIIKMLRQKFDQQWSLRKSESSEAEQQRIFNLIRPSQMLADARLRGPTMSAETILALEPGHVVMLDYPIHRPLTLEFYGTPKYSGQVVDTKNKRGFVLEKFIDPKE
jgi:flagellar motor switch protein FliM